MIIREHKIIIRTHTLIIRAHSIIIRTHEIICSPDIIIRAHNLKLHVNGPGAFSWFDKKDLKPMYAHINKLNKKSQMINSTSQIFSFLEPSGSQCELI